MVGKDLVARLIAELVRMEDATVESIVGQVATLTGYFIEVEPLGDKDWEKVTGLVVVDAENTHARILVRRSDPRWYQLHVVLHELGHLLYGHTGCAALPVAFDDLPQKQGVQVLARGVLTEEPYAAQEREAEELSHQLSEFVLAPRFAADEVRFG